MRYASLFILLIATPAQASGRAKICPEDKAEIKRIARLTRYNCGSLGGIIESERAAFNHQTMMQYNRQLPAPLPMIPTPEVPPSPGPGTFFPR